MRCIGIPGARRSRSAKIQTAASTSAYDAARNLFNAAVRFNFTYRPLSDIFVVYNEQRYRLSRTRFPRDGASSCS